MNLHRLTSSFDLTHFDCGDNDLNEFLIEDALKFSDKMIASTFILEHEGAIIAYFCLLNDKISQQEVTNSQWKKIKRGFPSGKHFSSYPAIKIGRFAVSKDYRGNGIGSDLLLLIKKLLIGSSNYSAFRFLTVDAYLSAIDFYTKNQFNVLSEKNLNGHTRLMYYDMMQLI